MRGAIGVLLAALLGASATSTNGATRTFESGGRRISAEIAAPPRAHGAPVAVLLAGRSGLDFYRARFDILSGRLTAAGYMVVIPAYLGRSAHDVPETVDAATLRLWRRTIRDAVHFAAGLPGADPKRVAIVGFSLGGFAGSSEAAVDAEIAAEAIHSAGLSSAYPADPKYAPPTFIVHATEDPEVTRAEAEALAAKVRGLGGEAELRLYPSHDHILSGDAFDRSAADTVDFLDRRLKPRPSAR